MKKTKGKTKISIFYFLVFLIITSVILVVYINNIIYINHLSVLNNNLKEKIKENVQTNDMLRTEAEKLSSFERVRAIAAEKFALSYKENSTEEKSSIIIKKPQLK